MKKLCVVVLMLASTVFASDAFCDGYEAGFERGACSGRNYCIPPISPICPIPRNSEESYSDGYDRGFIDGLMRSRR